MSVQHWIVTLGGIAGALVALLAFYVQIVNPIRKWFVAAGRKLNYIHDQFFPNGGGSLTDKVARIDQKQNKNDEEMRELRALNEKQSRVLDEQSKTLDELKAGQEGVAKQLQRMAHNDAKP